MIGAPCGLPLTATWNAGWAAVSASALVAGAAWLQLCLQVDDILHRWHFEADVEIGRPRHAGCGAFDDDVEVMPLYDTQSRNCADRAAEITGKKARCRVDVGGRKTDVVEFH